MSTPAFVSVKQNNSEFSGVVAHPFGQHTLLVPLTENVVYPEVWHMPPPLLAEDEAAQLTSENIVVAPLEVIFVVLGVMEVEH